MQWAVGSGQNAKWKVQSLKFKVKRAVGSSWQLAVQSAKFKVQSLK